VINPVKTNDNVDKEPSKSLYSNAFDVPRTCPLDPNANPLAIGLSILNILKIIGPNIAAIIPVNITIATVKYLIPPSDSEIPIAIAVVTLFGMNVAANTSDNPNTILKIPILNACPTTPTKIVIKTIFQCFFNTSKFSYKGTAKDTVAGPIKNVINDVSSLYDS